MPKRSEPKASKTPKLSERSRRSIQATINNLERAAAPGYDGRAATEKARQSAWQSWMDKADGDSVRANRLRRASMLRGRLERSR